MLNNVILYGRLVDKPKIKELEDGTKVCNAVLAVSKPFKNVDTGEYGVDFLPVTLWQGLADLALKWCNKGDSVIVKGRLSTKKTEVNGINISLIEIVGERLIFTESKSNNEEMQE